MKTIIVNALNDCNFSEAINYSLEQMKVNNCTGCWSCWGRTPGKCFHSDLDAFYHDYITADKVIFLSKVTKGFVSGDLKTLFDRMIPLFLPYISYTTGESRHIPRYEHYPDIEFYYEDQFEKEHSKQVFEAYVNRVFYHFNSENIMIKPWNQFLLE